MAEENKVFKKPLPEITPVNQPFWDGAKAGKLMMQKCRDCGTWVFCPRPVCGDCASDKLEWVQVSGKGKIFCFTVVREVVGQALRGFAPDIPLRHGVGRSGRRPALLQQHHRLSDRQSPHRHAGAKSSSKTAATESRYRSLSRPEAAEKVSTASLRSSIFRAPRV